MEKKYKVIEIIPSLSMGGAETLVKDYALLINENKFDLNIVCMGNRQGTANEEQLSRANKNVIYIPEMYDFLPNCVKKSINKILYRLGLLIVLNKVKPNVIHMHMGGFGYNKIASRYAKKKKINIFLTVHTTPSVLFDKTKLRLRDKNYLIKNKHIRLVALHDEMRKELNEMFGVNNTLVIKNGINMNRFKNLHNDREKMRASLNIDKDDFVIGHVGRMVYSKNHSFLIKLFSELILLRPKSHLLLVGEGELENEIKNQIVELNIEEKVTILKNRTDIPEILNAMDVFVFPSIFEGFGNVVIEAQAIGLKCIISDTIPKDVIVSENVKVIGLEETSNNWCNAILEPIVTTSGDYKKIEMYDMNNEIKRLEKLYMGELNE